MGLPQGYLKVFQFHRLGKPEQRNTATMLPNRKTVFIWQLAGACLVYGVCTVMMIRKSPYLAFVYNGNEGSTTSGPIVRQVMEAYFCLKDDGFGQPGALTRKIEQRITCYNRAIHLDGECAWSVKNI